MAFVALIRWEARLISLKSSRSLYLFFVLPKVAVSRLFCIFALDQKLDINEKDCIFDDDGARHHGG